MNVSASERALIFAPHGRDAQVASEMLKEAGLDALIAPDLPSLCEQLARGAGLAVITEEALGAADLAPLSGWIEAQPEWSDFPFVLLTARGGGLERNPSARRFLDVLGNVTFLERPFHPTTFVSLAQSALRGRRRQYEARSRLEAMLESESQARLAAARLAEESHTLETLNRTGAELGSILDRNEAVQRVTDAGTQLTGADFGAFFHNVVDERGESYMLYALSGVDRSHFDKFPMPRATAIFKPTFDGEGIVRSDDIPADPRFGKNPPYHGMPEGHLPVRSYLAVPVMSRFGKVLGGLFFGHSAPGRFTERHERLMAGLAGQAAIALDNANLFRAAERELEVRRRTETELKASNDRFRAAIDAVQGVLWTNDAEGRMEGPQPGWSALTGQTYEEYRGLGWARCVHPDDAEASVRAWERAVSERRIFVFEHRLRRADGEWRNYAVRAVPIFAESGEILQWVGVHTDITAQRTAETALLRLNSTLESRVATESTERQQAESQLRQVQKMDAIGQLTGGVAHDFNNLLTPIMGGLDMLRQRLEGDERAQRTISIALQAASRASTLVQRLLAFARRQDLQPRPVDVAALIEGMEELVTRSIGGLVNVTFEAPADLPPAHADPNQLELAILNLAINGRDAMPEGGRITISARSETLPKDEEDLAAGRYVCICVIDEGEGMDDETLRRAVEPFFSTKGVGKGTGLGVSMVHGLAAQSGGALRMISALGRGTTAEIWLPVAQIDAAAAAAPATRHPIAQGGGTVLLVDDDNLVRAGTAEMLAGFGYEVLEAVSGAEALAMLRTNPGGVDVLITDFLMPGMNGASLAQEARALVPGLPTLIITGYSNIAEGPGADLPRLTKPFRQVELAAEVARLMIERSLSLVRTA
ncbi:GAF domain-containing protein [Sphingomonas sp. LY54]|uniref:GAF domain-containing hybrid sensor histidine kinase/response regulator n=1 Tax=Sphingomonas sp. LY54 TaxID=3095343 RepID=UPI002D77A658|nr:GAF domain-containing protein [Sphingomonas sp. LY54]WRP28276.1 GAF domain-containing protein [Sphingomonas sp. LY54]